MHGSQTIPRNRSRRRSQSPVFAAPIAHAMLPTAGFQARTHFLSNLRRPERLEAIQPIPPIFAVPTVLQDLNVRT